MATKRELTRCWPGYEPVPGKRANSQGSCRPKAKSKLKASEEQFREKRKSQLDRWQKKHPGAKRAAAQHLSAPAATKTSARPKSRSRKIGANSRPKRTK